MKRILHLVALTVFTKPFLLLAEESTNQAFTISDPGSGLLLEKGSKVVSGVKSIEWLINMGAGLFAITCFISAGNLARQGQVGRAAGAAIGGVISVLGAYFVYSVTK